MKDFTNIPSHLKLYKDDYFFIIEDKYSVSKGHLFIISNELREDFFRLNNEEKNHLSQVIDVAKELIESKNKPDRYNIGMNCGRAAGQTVFHFHCHIIPRYFGDMENPVGGVRHCVKDKGITSLKTRNQLLDCTSSGKLIILPVI
jgi:diadenosine tetraphosphate (Ap4A) HIT family hydrolase